LDLWRILGFKCLHFLEKYSMIFQNSFIKSLIHKIKNINIFIIFWHVQIEEIENKMSKLIIKKQKVNHKILKKKIISHNKKKQIVNDGIYEEFWISNVSMFLKNIPWFSKILW